MSRAPHLAKRQKTDTALTVKQVRLKSTPSKPSDCLLQIAEDELTALASENWSVGSSVGFSQELVSEIYASELKGIEGRMPVPQRIALLEVSQYLERYLWPNFDAATATSEHLLSILMLINQKQAERTNPWVHFEQDQVLGC